jgi:ligand-binding sensor domain-containing protein
LLFGQTPQATKLQVSHNIWTFKEGAPQGIVAMAQTTDGFLWLGSPSGLFRFDGARFERFRPPFGDQLLSTNISGLFAPASGGLWIGYLFGGFSFLNNGRVNNYGADAASSGTVRRFAQDRDGIVRPPSLVGNSDDRLPAYPILRRKESWQIVDRTNSVWIVPRDPFYALSP